MIPYIKIKFQNQGNLLNRLPCSKQQIVNIYQKWSQKMLKNLWGFYEWVLFTLLWGFYEWVLFTLSNIEIPTKLSKCFHFGGPKMVNFQIRFLKVVHSDAIAAIRL